MFRLLLIAAVVQLGWSLTLEDCPYGLTRTKYLQVFGNLCYRFDMKGSKDYIDALKDCKKASGTLAHVRSQEINTFLATQLRDTYNAKGRIWIGLSDRNTENIFEWEDGTPFTNTSFTNFAKKEGPRKSFIQSEWEDCVALDPRSGKWYDYHCENEFFIIRVNKHYVCEYKPKNSGGDTSPTQKTCGEFTCDTSKLDCGLGGFKTDAKGCPICECE